MSVLAQPVTSCVSSTHNFGTSGWKRLQWEAQPWPPPAGSDDGSGAERSEPLKEQRPPASHCRAPTFAARVCHLGEGVVARVALAPDHAGPTLALAALRVARSRERTDGVAVTRQAGVRAPGVVMKLLETHTHTHRRRERFGERMHTNHNPDRNVTVPRIVWLMTSAHASGQDLCREGNGTRPVLLFSSLVFSLLPFRSAAWCCSGSGLYVSF